MRNSSDAGHMGGVAGALILDARLRAGMSQRALALAAGTSQGAVAAYEAGRHEPNLVTLGRLLAAAGFELRMRLEPSDDHDDTVAEWEATRPAAERDEWRDRKRLVAAHA